MLKVKLTTTHKLSLPVIPNVAYGAALISLAQPDTIIPAQNVRICRHKDGANASTEL